MKMLFLFHRWDNSDREFLSPWDLEPIDENSKYHSSINKCKVKPV